MGFGNNIQADPFPLGSSQAARGARSEAHGSENTAAVLFQTLLRDTGPVLRGREPPACETPPLVKLNLPCNARPARKTAPRPRCTTASAWIGLGKAHRGPFFSPKNRPTSLLAPNGGRGDGNLLPERGLRVAASPRKKEVLGGCRAGKGLRPLRGSGTVGWGGPQNKLWCGEGHGDPRGMANTALP